MAFCSNCGKEIENEVKFCSSCGKAINDTVNASVTTQSNANIIKERNNLLQKFAGNKIIGFGALLLCILFFILPLVKFSWDSSYTATCFQSATGTGDLFDNTGESIPPAFILIIIPVILAIMAFIIKSSFSSLRNVSIAGLVAKIIFLIYAKNLFASERYEGLCELTGNNWLVLVIYIGLCAIAFYCIIRTKKEQIQQSFQESPADNTVANNVQQSSTSTFSKETGIAIAAGVIIALLGSIILGIIINRGARIPIIWLSVHIATNTFIQCVLFGLLAGIICQSFVLSKKENSILKNTALIFLITFVLRILMRGIYFLIFSGRFRNMPFLDFISGRWIWINGLIAGILCSLAAFVYLKLRVKKELAPVEEIK